MSAQVSGGLRSLRGSTSSSSAEPVSIHTSSLRETLASFSQPASMTIRQLYDLASKLDHECLQHATNIALDPAQVSTSDVEIVAELAVFLSQPLSSCGYPGTFRFQEIQLRALVGALALLQHNGVHTLRPDVYDTLRLRNISARFQDIAFRVQPSSTLADRIRQAPNVYLVQLASQYVSFINRGDSPWPSVVGPIVDIFFAALSVGGGQYQNTRSIIGGLNELVNIWQRPRTKHQALCGLQEYTRLATSLCRESAIADGSNELRTAATNIVTALFDKIDEILAVENTNLSPELPRRWHKVIALMGRGPPSLDQGYHYLGLFDCVSQLATVSDLTMLGEGLWNRVHDLIFESVVPEFRWKAIEIFLSCCCTRQEQYQLLKRDIRERVTAETKSIVLEEMRIIHMHLENDEEESLRLRISQPLTRVPPTIPPDPGVPEIEENGVEGALTRSRIKSSTPFSLRNVRKFSSSYHSAGLSDDCTQAVFNDDSEVSVYKLGDLRRKPASLGFTRVFTQKYQRKHQEFIRIVASSRSYIVIVTNKRLLVFGIDPETAIDTFPHENWDPSGLACHESETQLVVFLGQCQRNSRTSDYCGQIGVYRYRKEGQSKKLPSFVLNVPANDYPKRLSFHAGSQILTCITRLQNKLLVWKLKDDFWASWGPYEFKKNDYTAETTEVGVTSATVYRSPTNRIYVLCTTAPSKERWHHDGEWSFILPIPVGPARAHTHSGSCIQDLEQFQNHGPLFAGCSSSEHHVLAVLEKSGRLSFLRLDKHEDGGIHSPGQNPEILAHSLCKQDRPLTGCLRFDPSGSFLFAVDPKGKIVVTEFENE